MQPGRIRLADYVALARGNRQFRLLWFAQIVSEIGDWLYAVVLYDLLLERTGSAQAVATAVVLQVLPQVLVAPMAGVINDRLSRRTVMIAADIARCAIVLGMLAATHMDTLWPIYALLLSETLMWGFFEPARSAILPNLTSGGRVLLVANALASTTWSFNLAIGSALGGLLGVMFGRDAVFVINSLTFVGSALLLTRMQVHEPHTMQGRMRAADLANFSSVAEGFRYISREKRLTRTMLAKFGLGFLGAHYIILPIFGERIFPVEIGGISGRRASMLGMSLLMGARGLGALIGPLGGGYWAGDKAHRLRSGIGHGFVIAGAGYLLLSVSPNIGVAIAAVILSHAGGAVVWVFSTTILQTVSEDRFRGRVFAADFALLVMAMSVSSYVSGLFVDSGVSVRLISTAVGLLALLPALLWWLTRERPSP
ncbi:MAG: MFS transporter [Acidimicrobiia bacterium]|nr:MFS transporter [Acidimicrobiia bacterium]